MDEQGIAPADAERVEGGPGGGDRLVGLDLAPTQTWSSIASRRTPPSAAAWPNAVSISARRPAVGWYG